MIAIKSPRRTRSVREAKDEPISPPSLERSVSQELANDVQRIAELAIEFIEHDRFARAKPDAAVERVLAEVDPPLSTDPNEAAQLLTAEEEVRLFRELNWFKYWADHLRQKLIRRPSVELVQRIDRLWLAATKIRNRLIQTNLRLVPFVARNFVDRHNSLHDLISDGHMTLIRSVERFDFSRGFRFSTYATWALRFTLARLVSDGRRRRGRFSNLEQFDDATGHEVDREVLTESAYPTLKQSVARLLDQLDPREREIVHARFGIARLSEDETLKQIARRMGICKERVRQLEIRAIAKLRKLAEQAGVRDQSWVLA